MSAVQTKTTTMFSLPTVKAYLAAGQGGALDPSDTSMDTLIQQVADAVSEKFEQQTRRFIVTRTGLIETWNGTGSRAHFLRRMDVQAITALTVDGLAVDPATVALDGPLGLLQLLDTAAVPCFGRGVANCAATYTAGLDDQDGPALPSDVLEACLEWVKAIVDEKRSGATTASSITIGPSSLVLKPGLGFNIKQTVDAWKDLRA